MDKSTCFLQKINDYYLFFNLDANMSTSDLAKQKLPNKQNWLFLNHKAALIFHKSSEFNRFRFITFSKIYLAIKKAIKFIGNGREFKATYKKRFVWNAMGCFWLNHKRFSYRIIQREWKPNKYHERIMANLNVIRMENG